METRKRLAMTISEMQKAAYNNAKDHGFHEIPMNLSEKLMLIVSELAEAMEEVRDPSSLGLGVKLSETGKPEGFVVELADAVIRIGDLCGALELNLETAIRLKMTYNKDRPFKHGKAF
jgi:NTP pyrophosphatase (non-canonical NTP hydrolase)